MGKISKKIFTRSITGILTAATIATSIPLTQASAASAGAVIAKPAAVTTDLSARRYYRGAGGAVALGALAIIAGAAIAASRHDDYCGGYGCRYAYAPGPYYGGGYYGGGYYGRGYYGGYHRWHHRH
ncbi:MAG: hypothetical protein ACR2K5_07300 [Pseudolabrys sp.]